MAQVVPCTFSQKNTSYNNDFSIFWEIFWILIHPQGLTWNLKMMGFNRNLLFRGGTFHHVKPCGGVSWIKSQKNVRNFPMHLAARCWLVQAFLAWCPYLAAFMPCTLQSIIRQLGLHLQSLAGPSGGRAGGRSFQIWVLGSCSFFVSTNKGVKCEDIQLN